MLKMLQGGSIQTRSDQNDLEAQVELLTASDALGRSPTLGLLLRYLLGEARRDHVPKELEIAEAVFARSGDELDSDASVRVYLHRLRRKLDEYYAGPGASQPVRLCLPKGSYRLTIVPQSASEVSGAELAKPLLLFTRNRKIALAVTAAITLAVLAGWFGRLLVERQEPIAQVQRSAVWRPLLDDDRRIAVVLGDYYIFGELNDMGEVGRMVHEFNVHSAKELEVWRTLSAGRANRYINLDLTYLPVGVADAMRSIMPILVKRGDSAKILTVAASQLDVRIVPTTNLVYLGYISGLGDMRNPVFADSRFAIGESYDEIIERKTGKHYVADRHLQSNDRPGTDYAIVSSFKGPSGNRILVIAGTRDAALTQAARFVSNPDTVKALGKLAASGGAYEALISVDTVGNVGLHATLITASTRPDASWNKPAKLTFPDELTTSPN